MITIYRVYYHLHTFIRRLALHCQCAYIRYRMQRAGRPAYSDAAMMLGVLANERAKWTGESYEDAARAEVPKVRESGLVARRDIDQVEAALRESLS